MKNSNFYLTTTLPYVNAELHMGHALEFIRADAIARYKKLMGYEVFFNTGTDEHGMKILEKAKEEGMEVQAFVDKNFEKFKESIQVFGMTEDVHFIRTTDEYHIKSAQEFWRRCDKNGYIYKKNYKTKYCVGCEEEKSDSELVDGFCVIHPGKELLSIEEENYFFKYSAFGEKLLKLYEENPTFVIPDFRFNEVKAFVERGLQDFSISRLKTKMPWGIPVPGDDEHVMYVWFDALTNYINTLGWPDKKGIFENFWVHGNPTQYCGKDNTRFQSAMWQAMLMAAGVPNSHQIVVNGFITGEGGVKMSKSLGNVVNPKEIVEEYGTDALRYFMLREISSFEDSPFTKERFHGSYNSGLANGLGNLTSRIMKMAETNLNNPVNVDSDYPKIDISKEMDQFDISKAMSLIWGELNYMDGIIQSVQPFKLVKTDKEKGIEEIQMLVKRLDRVASTLQPFLPETSKKIKEAIKLNKMPETPLFLRKD